MALARELVKKDAAHKRAVEMLKRAPLIDGHNDLPWVVRKATGGDLEAYDLTKVHPETDTDIPRLKAGMVNVQVLAAFLPSEIASPATVTLEQIDLIRRIEARHADVFVPIRRAADVPAAKKSGKIGSLISVEGTVGCEGSLAPLRIWHHLGVRLVTLCHNGSLPWIDSSTDAPRAGGLSNFGHEMIAEMNRLGIIIDCSHVAPSAAQLVVKASRAPIVLSHSNAHKLCSHPRNAPDDLIKAVAKSGGVVMATFVPSFINADIWTRLEAERVKRGRPMSLAELLKIEADLERSGEKLEATLEQFCRHVEHLLKVAGPDHVGIGSDFYGGPVPVGLEDCSTYPAFFAEMIRRGHGEQVLERVAGANFLRMMRRVEKISRQIVKETAPKKKPRQSRKPKTAALILASAPQAAAKARAGAKVAPTRTGAGKAATSTTKSK
jgi:membrane dipeptidase